MADTRMDMEDYRVISNATNIIWVMYYGKLPGNQVATGYNVEQHEAWCIPMSTWARRDVLSPEDYANEAMREARKLKIKDDGTVKRNYEDREGTKWWVVAPAPDANPQFGEIIQSQLGDRENLNSVPTSTSVTSGDPISRLKRQREKQKESQEDRNHPGIGDTMIGTTLIRADGSVQIFPADSPIPLLELSNKAAKLAVRSTKLTHDPDQMSFAGHSVNPMAKDLPSTNTMPVQTFTISNPDLLMVAAMAISVARYLQSERNRDKDKRTSSHKIVPTEFIDYEDLLRGSS